MFFVYLLACNNALESDGSWGMSITGLETSCPGSEGALRENLIYDLYYQGSFVEIRIGDELFATGQRSGCYLEYQSSEYVEKAPGGDFVWSISGTAEYQGEAKGCTQLPDKTDWYGSETILVTSSENEDFPEQCYYETQTVGVFGQDASECCMICEEGFQACQGGCISEEETCSQGAGCACNFE